MAGVFWIYLELRYSCICVSVPPEAKFPCLTQGTGKHEVFRLLLRGGVDHLAQIEEPLKKWQVLPGESVASCFGACW